jgi:hypothetical protein
MLMKCTQSAVNAELDNAKMEVSRLLADGFQITEVATQQRADPETYDGSFEATMIVEVHFVKKVAKE